MNRVNAPNPSSPQTILILDDDNALRRAVVGVLARHGYRVLTAENAAHAIEVVGGWVGPIDLLLCGLVLPGLAGREAASMLMSRRPGMKVIFTSGFRTRGQFREQLDHPDALLSKPFGVPELLDAVDTVLRGGCWPDADVVGG